MRQYRGLTKEGKWVYGWYYHWNSKGKDFIMQQHINSVDITHVEVIPETVGQFTGLKDENGKDLNWWEGDIFARASDRQIEGFIVFDMSTFWLDRVRGGRTPLYECVDWSMCRIGNIHQNPELMEKK